MPDLVPVAAAQRFPPAESAVAAQDDLHIRPRLPQPFDRRLQRRTGFFGGIDVRRAQMRRHPSIFIGSGTGTDAAALAKAVRGHGSMENNLHWQPDVSFRGYERRIRTSHGAENYSRLGRPAQNLLKWDKSVKVGIHGKRLKAGWDEHYLLQLLNQ